MGDAWSVAAAVEGVPFPVCPEHSGFRVLRDGFAGTAPARRQRFRCVNPDDRSDWHRIGLPVARAVAEQHRCLDCQQIVPPHAGPVVAGSYHYLSKVVAAALVEVAKGRTYSEASQAARLALDVAGGHHPEAHGVEFSSHGQLAADWTEVFADVVVPEVAIWPQVVLLDSTSFWRRRNRTRVPAFTLLFAYGYDLWHGPLPEPDDPFVTDPPREVAGRLLRIGLADSAGATSWTQFLTGWSGQPAVAVGDAALGKPVGIAWPQATFVRCVHHWRANLVTALTSDLVRITGHPSKHRAVTEHPLMLAASHALTSSQAFDEFTRAAGRTFTDHPEFADLESSTLKWLRTNADDATAQLHAADERPGPQSIGPLEQVIDRTRQHISRRAQALRNPTRTQRLLNLLAAGQRNEANTDVWADRLYNHLAAHEGRPQHRQREVTGRTL